MNVVSFLIENLVQAKITVIHSIVDVSYAGMFILVTLLKPHIILTIKTIRAGVIDVRT